VKGCKPENLVHFNGSKFLVTYDMDGKDALSLKVIQYFWMEGRMFRVS